MINDYFFHDAVTPEQMDRLWAQGWRHFGRYFYRYSATQLNGQLNHVLPLRIRLADFKPNRTQRRSLKRNRDLRVVTCPAFVDPRVEALFERHKTRYKTNIPDSIYSFVSKRPHDLPCPCISLSLLREGDLIGISYLDVGKTSSSSVYQCFDPDYGPRSLGILMVLLSVQYAAHLGQHYYYPGYAYVEPSHYDYKKRFSALEGYDWQKGWRDYSEESAKAERQSI